MRTASNLSFIPLQAKPVGIKLKKKSAYPVSGIKNLSVCNQYVSKKISPLVARPVFFHPFYHVCLKKWWNGFIATVFSDWSQIFNPDLYYLQEVRNFSAKISPLLIYFSSFSRDRGKSRPARSSRKLSHSQMFNKKSSSKTQRSHMVSCFNSIQKCFNSKILKSETFIMNNEKWSLSKINYDVKSHKNSVQLHSPSEIFKKNFVLLTPTFLRTFF